MGTLPIKDFVWMLEDVGCYGRLSVATKEDYKCYYMNYNDYDKDQASNTKLIGYHKDVDLEGKQFISICKIVNGKIDEINLSASTKALPALKIYIKSQEDKLIIV